MVSMGQMTSVPTPRKSQVKIVRFQFATLSQVSSVRAAPQRSCCCKRNDVILREWQDRIGGRYPRGYSVGSGR